MSGLLLSVALSWALTLVHVQGDTCPDHHIWESRRGNITSNSTNESNTNIESLADKESQRQAFLACADECKFSSNCTGFEYDTQPTCSRTITAHPASKEFVKLATKFSMSYGWCSEGFARQEMPELQLEKAEAIRGGQSLMALSNHGNVLVVGFNKPEVFNRSANGTWLSGNINITSNKLPLSRLFSVALSSDGQVLAIGGSRADDNNGVVLVFEHNMNMTYSEVNFLKLGDGMGTWFGHIVSLSNDGQTLAVGASTTQKEECSGVPTDVALSGDGLSVAVSSVSANDPGSVWVYRNVTERKLGGIDGVDTERSRGILLKESSECTNCAWVLRWNESQNSWNKWGDDIKADDVEQGGIDSAGCNEQKMPVALSSNGSVLAVGGPTSRLFKREESVNGWNEVEVSMNVSTGSKSVALNDDGSILVLGRIEKNVVMLRQSNDSFLQSGDMIDGEWVSLPGDGCNLVVGRNTATGYAINTYVSDCESDALITVKATDAESLEKKPPFKLQQADDDILGPVLGGVFGGLTLACLFIFCACLFMRSRKRKATSIPITSTIVPPRTPPTASRSEPISVTPKGKDSSHVLTTMLSGGELDEDYQIEDDDEECIVPPRAVMSNRGPFTYTKDNFMPMGRGGPCLSTIIESTAISDSNQSMYPTADITSSLPHPATFPLTPPSSLPPNTPPYLRSVSPRSASILLATPATSPLTPHYPPVVVQPSASIPMLHPSENTVFTNQPPIPFKPVQYPQPDFAPPGNPSRSLERDSSTGDFNTQ